MLQQREEWNHQPRGAVVIDTEDSDLDKEDSVIPPLIYTEYSDDKEYHPCGCILRKTIPSSGDPSSFPIWFINWITSSGIGMGLHLGVTIILFVPNLNTE